MTTYILDGHTPVKEPDLKKWAERLEPNRAVNFTRVYKGVEVSTVFLGVDHSFTGGPPILFETMIFGGEFDGYQTRCSTWKQAEAMHRRALIKCGMTSQINKQET